MLNSAYVYPPSTQYCYYNKYCKSNSQTIT
nr:MAG TPA: hypothetical protein [Caudoviricetes sp.]DAT99346.1 MAG TPA: hypothetical protein [Caudoviricetes sp.]